MTPDADVRRWSVSARALFLHSRSGRLLRRSCPCVLIRVVHRRRYATRTPFACADQAWPAFWTKIRPAMLRKRPASSGTFSTSTTPGGKWPYSVWRGSARATGSPLNCLWGSRFSLLNFRTDFRSYAHQKSERSHTRVFFFFFDFRYSYNFNYRLSAGRWKASLWNPAGLRTLGLIFFQARARLYFQSRHIFC